VGGLADGGSSGWCLRVDARAAARVHPADDVEHAQGGQVGEAFFTFDAVEVSPQGDTACRLAWVEGCGAHVIPPAFIPVRRRPPEHRGDPAVLNGDQAWALAREDLARRDSAEARILRPVLDVAEQFPQLPRRAVRESSPALSSSSMRASAPISASSASISRLVSLVMISASYPVARIPSMLRATMSLSVITFAAAGWLGAAVAGSA
jgi:hypothetical protein